MERHYQVSNTGKVLGLKRGKELKQHHNSKGYLRVTLTKEGKRPRFVVHRLVASAFIENPHEYPQVNHKDGDKENNHVENLEWCSQEMNMRHAFENGMIHRLQCKFRQ